MKSRVIAAIAAAALSACTLMPHYQRPESPVADRWPANAGDKDRRRRQLQPCPDSSPSRLRM